METSLSVKSPNLQSRLSLSNDQTKPLDTQKNEIQTNNLMNFDGLHSNEEPKINLPNEAINRRKYQIKASIKARCLNSLIILPKKLGKTTILTIIVFNIPDPEKIVFVSNDEESVRQLSSFFSVEPFYSTGTHENQALWEKQRIIFSSTDVLFNAVTKEQIKPFNPEMIIFDDINIDNLCEKEKIIINSIKNQNKCRIIETTSIMPNDKNKIQEIITAMKAEQIIFIDTGKFKSNEYDDLSLYIPKQINFSTNDTDIESMVECFDKIIQKYIDFLFDKGYVHSNQPSDFTNEEVFSALRNCQSAGKKLSTDVQHTFNILLQLSSIRDKLINYGPSQAFAAIESLTKKKMTEQRKKLLNSPQYINFVKLLNSSREKLHPKFASVAKLVEETIRNGHSQEKSNEEKDAIDNNDSSTNTKIVILANLEDTCKCLSRFLKEKNRYNDENLLIKTTYLTTKSKKEKLNLFKTGQINVIVMTYDNMILVEKIDVTLYIMFDQPNTMGYNIRSSFRQSSSLAGKNVVALQPEQNFLDSSSSDSLYSQTLTEETRTILSNSKDNFTFWSPNSDDDEKSDSSMRSIHSNEENLILNLEQKENELNIEEKSGLSSPERPDSFIQGSEIIFSYNETLSQLNIKQPIINMNDIQTEFTKSQNVCFRKKSYSHSSSSDCSIDSITSNSISTQNNNDKRNNFSFSQPPCSILARHKNTASNYNTHSQFLKFNGIHKNRQSQQNIKQDVSLVHSQNSVLNSEQYQADIQIQQNKSQQVHVIEYENQSEEKNQIELSNQYKEQTHSQTKESNVIEHSQFQSEQQNPNEEQNPLVDQKQIEHQNYVEEQNRIEQQKLVEEQNQIEQQQLVEEQNQYDHQNYVEEQNQIEQQKLVEEQNQIEQQQLVEEQNQIEQQKLVEEQNQYDHQNYVEEQNQIEQQKLVEEQNQIEQQKLVEEHNQIEHQVQNEQQNTIEEQNQLVEQNQLEHQDGIEEQNQFEQQKQFKEQNHFSQQVQYEQQNRIEEPKHFSQQIRNEYQNTIEAPNQFRELKQFEERNQYEEQNQFEQQNQTEEQNLFDGQNQFEEQNQNECKNNFEEQNRIMEQIQFEEKNQMKDSYEEQDHLEQQNQIKDQNEIINEISHTFDSIIPESIHKSINDRKCISFSFSSSQPHLSPRHSTSDHYIIFSQNTKQKNPCKPKKKRKRYHQHSSCRTQQPSNENEELSAIDNAVQISTNQNPPKNNFTSFLDDSSFTEDENNYIDLIEKPKIQNNETLEIKTKQNFNESLDNPAPTIKRQIDVSSLINIENDIKNDTNKRTKNMTFLSTSDSEIDDFLLSNNTQMIKTNNTNNIAVDKSDEIAPTKIQSKQRSFLSDVSSSQFIEDFDSDDYIDNKEQKEMGKNVNVNISNSTNLNSNKENEKKSFLSDSFDDFSFSQIQGIDLNHRQKENQLEENQTENAVNSNTIKPEQSTKAVKSFLQDSDDDDDDCFENIDSKVEQVTSNIEDKVTAKNCQASKSFLNSSDDDECYDY